MSFLLDEDKMGLDEMGWHRISNICKSKADTADVVSYETTNISFLFLPTRRRDRNFRLSLWI